MQRSRQFARVRRLTRAIGFRTVALLLSASLLAVPWLLAARHAHAQDAVKLRVELTDTGFNGNAGDFTIDAPQGRLVELTFVWAHKALTHEEHIMVLEGYKLESEKITPEHREATFRFLADKAGTFGFKCDLDCEAHDFLQRGRLRIRSGSGDTAAVTLTPTTLVLTPAAREVTSRAVTLTTLLKDDKGQPVPKAQVHFAVDREFGGTKGRMAVGTATTDANGVAFLDYAPATRGAQTIVAQFEGKGTYAESEQKVEIEMQGTPRTYEMEPIGLERIRGWAPGALVAVVLGVWVVFGFALYQAYGISRVRKQE